MARASVSFHWLVPAAAMLVALLVIAIASRGCPTVSADASLMAAAVAQAEDGEGRKQQDEVASSSRSGGSSGIEEDDRATSQQLHCALLIACIPAQRLLAMLLVCRCSTCGLAALFR